VCVSGHSSFQVGRASRPLCVLCGMFVSLVLVMCVCVWRYSPCYILCLRVFRKTLEVRVLIVVLTNVRLCGLVSINIMFIIVITVIITTQ
jgi:hypothetical protein